MKISFIIPIYKVEKYLSNCISSLVAQSYKESEIILVDDGSPDSCPSICDDWAKKDSRIKVIHKENQGLGMARNTGLKNATGDYVVFVDSDDFWKGCDSLQKIVEVLTKDTEIDLLFFNVFYYDNTTGKEIKWKPYPAINGGKSHGCEAFKKLVQSGVVPMSAWSKVVKRDILIQNNILFPSKIYGEDIPWFITLMGSVGTVTFLNEYIYAYRQNVTTSITKSNQPKHVRDMKYIIEHEVEKVGSEDYNQDCKIFAEAFIAYNYCILMSQYGYTEKSESEDYWRFMKKYSYLLNNTLHPKVRKVKLLKNIIGLKNTCRFLKMYKGM